MLWWTSGLISLGRVPRSGLAGHLALPASSIPGSVHESFALYLQQHLTASVFLTVAALGYVCENGSFSAFSPWFPGDPLPDTHFYYQFLYQPTFLVAENRNQLW